MKSFRAITVGAFMYIGAIGSSCAGQDQTGVYSIRSIPNTSLDYRKIYFIFGRSKVIGFFDNPATRPDTNDGGDPTCRFFLKGPRTTDNLVLESSYFDTISGRPIQGAPVRLIREGANWKISVTGDLPNCVVSTVDNGDIGTFVKSTDWINFATVKASKAKLYLEPSTISATQSYLVRFDPVAVISRIKGWTQINYFSSGRGLIRWIRTDALSELPE